MSGGVIESWVRSGSESQERSASELEGVELYSVVDDLVDTTPCSFKSRAEVSRKESDSIIWSSSVQPWEWNFP